MSGTNPFPLAAIDASGEEIRQLIEAIFGGRSFVIGETGVPTINNGGYGVVGPNSYLVSGGGTSASCAAGIATLKGTQTAEQHGYVVGNDAPVNFTVATTTSLRYDLVVVRLRDNEYGGGFNNGDPVVVTGTPSSTPTDPTVPDSALVLARLRVDPTGIYQVDDLRPRATAIGGEVVCTSDTRPDWAWPGLRIYETDTGNHLVYYGTSEWQLQWNMPWGLVGLGVTPAGTPDQWVTAATLADVEGCSADFTVPGHRRIHVEASGLIAVHSGSTNPRIVLTNSTLTQVKKEAWLMDGFSASAYERWCITAEYTSPTGGPVEHNVKAQVYNSGGTNTFKFANSLVLQSLVVTDLGPSAAPT